MTVEELIEKLQKFPADAVVKIYAYDDYQDDPISWFEMEEVELVEEDNTPPVVQISY